MWYTPCECTLVRGAFLLHCHGPTFNGEQNLSDSLTFAKEKENAAHHELNTRKAVTISPKKGTNLDN
jgi:hypothetical protein